MLPPDPRFELIDTMSGREFEEALVELFERLGFADVQRTGAFDKGADLIVVDEGERVAIQAKRAAHSVGIHAVRQLIDGIRRYRCQRGIVVTNSYFTEQATECADAWQNVDLWDRRLLADFLEGVDQTTSSQRNPSRTTSLT
jgi:restriction system protein